jgi:serine/threonine-protein kinase
MLRVALWPVTGGTATSLVARCCGLNDIQRTMIGRTAEDPGLRTEVGQALRGHFTIERELPRGGMSRVFVGTEDALRRPVVIKVLAPDVTATLSAERFKREIALAARLQHPHIVPLLSAGHAGTHVYYTMPFVDGESLRERMSRERPMSFENISRILEEVARALAYAHAEGVVHRDIKPENVMFFHDQAVVLDFGIAKALMSASTSEHETAGITQAGMTLGTPTYIAPEQSAADVNLDHRADLYALGVVAYEMLTGHPPFTGRSARVIIEAHALKRPDAIATRRPDVPKHLAAIVMRMLEKDPDNRPANGLVIVEALRSGNTPQQSAGIIGSMTRVPVWVPWVIAGASLAVAIVLLTLLLRGN